MDWDGLGVLDSARFVMARARHVRLVPEAIATVGADFARREVPVPAWNAELHFTDGTPRTANYLLLLDGLNFSFWGEPRWGITYHGRNLRGYWALAAALKRAIEEGLALDDAQVMASLTAEQLAHVLRGRGEIPLFEARLAHARAIGERLTAGYGGQFTRVIEKAGRDAVALARLLAAEFPFDDRSRYVGQTVCFYKRAQILPADLYGAFGGQGWGALTGLGELTAFADYKVPQVLCELGVLAYTPALTARLRAGTVLDAGSPEEVEIRAATVVGCELLREAMAAHGREVMAIEMDWMLWEMGLSLGPAAMPYHLTRTTAY